MAVLYLVVTIVCAAQRRRIEALLAGKHSGAAVAIVSASGLLGHAVLVSSPAMGDGVALVTSLVIVGFFLTIVWIVGAIFAWGEMLRRLRIEQAFFAVIASNTLSYGLQLACNAVSPTALLGLLILCPLGSAVCWIAAAQMRPTPSPVSTSSSIRTALQGLPWKLIGPAVALIYFEQLFSSLLFDRYAFWPRNNLTITLGVGCALWGAVSVYMGHMFFRNASHRPFETILTGLFATLLVIYMGALLATLIFPEVDSVAVERFLVAAGSSFRVLIWLSITVTLYQNRSSLVIAYLVYVFFVLTLPISRFMALALDLVPQSVIAVLTTPTAIVASAGVMLFLIAAIFVLSSARKNAKPAPPRRSPQDAARSLAAESGLSPRETDVLELVCRGLTAKRIGEKLGISESTVVSHMSHMYRKLGVSSKQELIALVEMRAHGQ